MMSEIEGRDLSGPERSALKSDVIMFVQWLHGNNQSLAIAREAMIAAFDDAAEKLDA